MKTKLQVYKKNWWFFWQSQSLFSNSFIKMESMAAYFSPFTGLSLCSVSKCIQLFVLTWVSTALPHCPGFSWASVSTTRSLAGVGYVGSHVGHGLDMPAPGAYTCSHHTSMFHMWEQQHPRWESSIHACGKQVRGCRSGQLRWHGATSFQNWKKGSDLHESAGNSCTSALLSAAGEGGKKKKKEKQSQQEWDWNGEYADRKKKHFLLMVEVVPFRSSVFVLFSYWSLEFSGHQSIHKVLPHFLPVYVSAVSCPQRRKKFETKW